jgi:hypothetical protein
MGNDFSSFRVTLNGQDVPKPPLVDIGPLKVCDHADRLIKLGRACFITDAFYEDVATASRGWRRIDRFLNAGP